MRTPSPLPPHRGGHRRGKEIPRPIAAGIKLSEDHIGKIDQSHERCAALGVSRIERPDHTPLPHTELQTARERNRRLHGHAAPVMEMLYEQIVQSQSMVVLTDATGTIIHSIGDDDFLERASKVALKPGAVWSETAKGTNAIGTALVEEVPTLVHADEHYVHAHHFLTCSAAPILDPRGNILGVLDVSGDHRSYHQHTMALVKMSARMIENGWLSDDYRNVMRLHFHGRAEFIGTLMEGILAVAADGRIVGANRGALEQLGLSGAALRMHSLSTLFGTSVGALVDRFRSALATPAPVHTSDGRAFHIMARFNWPVWASLAEALAGTAPALDGAAGPAPAAPLHPEPPRPEAAPATAPACALARLRTGDAPFDTVLDRLRRVLDRDIPILILGETGTGKERLARAVHADSERAQRPFVAVHCAAIPEPLLEAELFGGAGGGAGKIAQASGGSLFLDEIGDLPLTLQARLLRVLQERQVALPGSGRSAPVDLALICATRHNLRERIESQAFREDLFYRLNGLAVRLPPLRERADLPTLVRRILERECGGRHIQLGPDVAALFRQYPWPGNERQLFNVLRTACVMAVANPTITLDHLADDFLEDALAHQAAQAAQMAAAPAPPPAPPPHELAAPTVRKLDEMEVDAIRRAVELAGGNISEASKRLGISRNTIYRKLRRSQSR